MAPNLTEAHSRPGTLPAGSRRVPCITTMSGANAAPTSGRETHGRHSEAPLEGLSANCLCQVFTCPTLRSVIGSGKTLS